MLQNQFSLSDDALDSVVGGTVTIDVNGFSYSIDADTMHEALVTGNPLIQFLLPWLSAQPSVQAQLEDEYYSKYHAAGDPLLPWNTAVPEKYLK